MPSSSIQLTRFRAVALTLSALAVATGLACSSSSGNNPDQPSADAAVSVPVADVVVGLRDSAQLVSAVRVGNMTEDFGGIDLCYREVGGGPFEGPLLRSALFVDAGADATDASDATASPDAGVDAGADVSTDADAGVDASDADTDAGGTDASLSSAGLLPFTVTNYLTLVGSGTYELAIVRGDAQGCGDRLGAGTITADPGKLVTILLSTRVAESDSGESPDAGTALRMVSLVDDPSVDETRTRVRMVHVLPGASTLTVSLDRPSGTSIPLAGSVMPNKAASQSPGPPVIDALGYALLAPVAPKIDISVQEASEAGGLRFAFGGDVGLSAAALHTGYIAGTPKRPHLVWCSDKSVVGKRLDCTTYTP
jgi:hypothetical protein